MRQIGKLMQFIMKFLQLNVFINMLKFFVRIRSDRKVSVMQELIVLNGDWQGKWLRVICCILIVLMKLICEVKILIQVSIFMFQLVKDWLEVMRKLQDELKMVIILVRYLKICLVLDCIFMQVRLVNVSGMIIVMYGIFFEVVCVKILGVLLLYVILYNVFVVIYRFVKICQFMLS